MLHKLRQSTNMDTAVLLKQNLQINIEKNFSGLASTYKPVYKS